MLEHLALLNRRHMLRATMAGAVAVGAAGCARIVPQGLGLALTPSFLTDAPVLNFALNLEYLEAEYYLRGVNGIGLADELLGPKPAGVTGGRQVTFRTPYIREFMAEIANDENNHVTYIRRAIKGKLLVEMSRPAIDFTSAFAAVGELAGLGSGFDPFADEESFLLGAFLFEDVGVSAYTGAAKRISSDMELADAAGILAVEAYHAGMIRAQIAEMGPAMIDKAHAITKARDTLDGDAVAEAPTTPGRLCISNTDADGRAFPRRVKEVLNIAYGTHGKDV
ncbi:MAG: ferritin-like domain-containing protein, partial [Sphingomonadaceae bacterium]|nr:ferritin-like domain-containing protein [Sphingomonadaceae bacterium]